MTAALSPAQKAWVTRRNGKPSGSPAHGPVTDRSPDIELVMSISIGQNEGIAEISCAFSHMQQGKPVSDSALSPDDRALSSIRLVANTSTADSNAVLIGYDHVRVSISGGTSADLESILPKMVSLDSVLAKAVEDSEDSSFAMALQAVAWDLRVNWIDYDGKRSKRGVAYPIGESISESVLALYQTSKA